MPERRQTQQGCRPYVAGAWETFVGGGSAPLVFSREDVGPSCPALLLPH